MYANMMYADIQEENLKVVIKTEANGAHIP
jgi:hypothetical protein